jgi:ceramide glucosyltransferase
LAAYFALRFIQAWAIGVWGMRDETARTKWWLLPLRDAVHFVVWVASFFSNRILWSGTEFRLESNGEMVAIGASRDAKREEAQFQAGRT